MRGEFSKGGKSFELSRLLTGTGLEKKPKSEAHRALGREFPFVSGFNHLATRLLEKEPLNRLETTYLDLVRCSRA